ncbi:MAG: dephospho-CoA kinase [Gaiellaceae bacterium]
MTQPLTVAITGGIGAGKSEALRAFERHGAAVISSDEIVHQLLREDDDVKSALVERFGASVRDENGAIDRSAVAAIVFSDRAELTWLEELLHPLVSAAYLRWRELLAELDEPPTICVTEVPLLFESGSDEYFDAIVAITASPRVRASRSIAPDAGLREKRLLSDEEKMERADFNYVNDGSLDELDAFVRGVLDSVHLRRAGCSDG